MLGRVKLRRGVSRRIECLRMGCAAYRGADPLIRAAGFKFIVCLHGAGFCLNRQVMLCWAFSLGLSAADAYVDA